MSRRIDMLEAVTAFAALAHPTRLAVFRLLLRALPDGVAAGAIALSLGVPHNTLSSHLQALSRAGLVRFRKSGRMVVYAADLEGARAIVTYLVADCCDGRPEVCAPLPARGTACLDQGG